MNEKNIKTIGNGLDDLYRFEIDEREKAYKSVKIPLKFINKSSNKDPQYATDGSSGFDIRAKLEHEVEVEAGERMVIPTGLYFDIPEGFEIQIRPRSGLAANHGITVLNTPGTIDSDYTGEIKIILYNTSPVNFIISNGNRIAQAIVAGVITKKIISLERVSKITKDTTRGAGGFGSTGK